MSGTDEISVEMAAVSGNVLMIGARQMTAGVVRQIPYGHWDHTCDPPIARLACHITGRCELDRQPHEHFIWSWGGEIRQCVISTWKYGDEYRPEDVAIVMSAPYVYAAGAR